MPFLAFKSTFQELAQRLETVWHAGAFLRALVRTKRSATRKWT